MNKYFNMDIACEGSVHTVIREEDNTNITNIHTHSLDSPNKTSANQFTCDICSKSFYKLKNLKRHQKLHSQDKKYKCDKCSCSYSRSDHLKRHLISHTENAEDQKPFKCEICIQRFSNRSHLNRHVSNIHLKVKPQVYACDKCEHSFNKKRKLTKHILTDHSEENKKFFECYFPFCGKSYFSKGKLDVHITKHHENNEECIKNLQEEVEEMNEDLNGNLKGDKKYIQCPFEDCLKCYTKMFNLKVHIKTFHYKVEEFKCSICLKTFKHKCTLEKHKKNLHKGVKEINKDIEVELKHIEDIDLDNLDMNLDIATGNNFDSLIDTKTN